MNRFHSDNYWSDHKTITRNEQRKQSVFFVWRNPLGTSVYQKAFLIGWLLEKVSIFFLMCNLNFVLQPTYNGFISFVLIDSNLLFWLISNIFSGAEVHSVKDETWPLSFFHLFCQFLHANFPSCGKLYFSYGNNLAIGFYFVSFSQC